MSIDNNRVSEKLWETVRLLARSNCSVKERLEYAYREQLGFLFSGVHGGRYTLDDLPDDIREDLIALEERMTREEPQAADEGRLGATVRAMDNDEAREVVGEILRRHYEVMELVEQGR